MPRRECWDHFIFFEKTHLESVTKIWLEFYHRKRPHQGRENELLVKPKTTAKRKQKTSSQPERISLADVRCEQQLGGLLKSYSRRAA